ncbi:MAG: hypothetical protein CO137_01310 [Candidatus Magasanikbacteria bacterium CG_4_9_14_3_um_filter_32_9]|uniref:Uncharacterized protein n=1 Tax=Candidatus Magasanikbacteria bacterium CG_4_9_14_3_um_filter_32_9 TaxID=1974644 RepID=A0A2M7Z789_9BACT|nr:MAG: hypothetical protein CO137_01310 [Candidatus Magasanikbacteria bacterium CG_4_9_14_3_um_filter_32_9]
METPKSAEFSGTPVELYTHLLTHNFREICEEIFENNKSEFSCKKCFRVITYIYLRISPECIVMRDTNIDGVFATKEGLLLKIHFREGFQYITRPDITSVFIKVDKENSVCKCNKTKK